MLHTFPIGSSDGFWPRANLIFDDAGNLYGATTRGSDNGGTVFELTPGQNGTWTETILNNFCSTSCGSTYGGLIFDAAGNLYGTTSDGGSGFGYGTVFELTPGLDGTWTETTLYNFCSASNCADGAFPYGGVIFDAAGSLYGTTASGGTHEGGTVFQLTPAGGNWTEKVLHSFDVPGNYQAGPFSGVVFDSAGNLYGTVWGGGINSDKCDPDQVGCGIVFELTPNANGTWSEKNLHRFTGKDGANPWAGVVLDAAGNVYGTTYYGGAGCNGGCGVVFRLSQSNGQWTEKVIHDFDVSGTDGYFPYASLIFDAAGNLYGTASESAPDREGMVFELTPGADGRWTETIIHNWGTCEYGCGPEAGVIFDQHGNLYGTTLSCGSNCGGVVYEIKAKAH